MAIHKETIQHSHAKVSTISVNSVFNRINFLHIFSTPSSILKTVGLFVLIFLVLFLFSQKKNVYYRRYMLTFCTMRGVHQIFPFQIIWCSPNQLISTKKKANCTKNSLYLSKIQIYMKRAWNVNASASFAIVNMSASSIAFCCSSTKCI